MKKLSTFYKTLFTIALPIMMQYLITSSLNLMDSFIIGSLGEEAVAALGISNQYFFLFNLILMGICSGGNVLISQFWGKKDVKSIKNVLGISLSLGIVVSVIFTVFALIFADGIIGIFNKSDAVIKLGKSYLQIVCISYIFTAVSVAFGVASRGVQKTVIPMICSAIALIINGFLNYVFVFGHFNMPAMGVSGSALATLIARICEMVLILSFIYGKEHVLRASFKEMFSFEHKFFTNAHKVIIPVVINELCWGFGVVIYSVIYGNMGTKSIAAVQICTTIQNLFLIVLFGISNGACVMIGNEVGKDNLETARIYSKKLIKLCIGISVVMALSLALSSKFILKIYNISNEVYMNALYMILITAIILPIKFINILLIVGILRGGGDTSYTLKVELATMWLVGVPICALGGFVLNLEVYQVFLLVTLEEFAKCVLAVRRYKSNKWIKNLVTDMHAA